MANKYQPIADWLSTQPRDTVNCTFADLEEVLGQPLPPSARIHRAWWANGGITTHHVQAEAWLREGWMVDTVDLYAETVRFMRRLPSREQLDLAWQVVALIRREFPSALTHDVAAACRYAANLLSDTPDGDAWE